MSPFFFWYGKITNKKIRENYVRPTVLPSRPTPVVVSPVIQLMTLSDVDII